MHRGLLLFFSLVFLAAEHGWACSGRGDERLDEGIAAKACGRSEWQFPELKPEVRGVYVNRRVLRVYLGDELLDRVKGDLPTTERWVQSLRKDPEIQWQGHIQICTEGEERAFPWNGSLVAIDVPPDGGLKIVRDFDDPVSCSPSRQPEDF